MPTIIDIKPINLPELLGLNPAKEEEFLEKLAGV